MLSVNRKGASVACQRLKFLPVSLHSELALQSCSSGLKVKVSFRLTPNKTLLIWLFISLCSVLLFSKELYYLVGYAVAKY